MPSGRGYALGVGRDPRDRVDYPYGVSLDPSNSERPIILWEGRGHGELGGCFTPAECLDPQWAEHFRVADCLWLLPLLERMAGGEDVSLTEIVAGYEAHHGKSPRRIRFAR